MPDDGRDGTKVGFEAIQSLAEGKKLSSSQRLVHLPFGIAAVVVVLYSEEPLLIHFGESVDITMTANAAPYGIVHGDPQFSLGLLRKVASCQGPKSRRERLG